MAENATIYDVAKKAGVSPATVSRVLNEPAKVSAEKREKIFAAISELNFVPKAAAVANARQSFRKIGVIAPFFTQPSFMQRLRGISNVLFGHHYELVIYSIGSAEDQDMYIDMLSASRRVDGLIVLCLNLGEKNLEKLRQSGLPVCFVEQGENGFDSVTIDNFESGRKVAEYFYNKGCRCPCFMGEASERAYAIHATEMRIDGFKSFWAEKDIQIAPDHIWLGSFGKAALDSGIEIVFASKKLPDCIFTSCDMIAVRLMEMAGMYKIKIPQDIKLVGFDNLDIAHYLNLSTVSQHLDESGKLAASLVLQRIKDPESCVRDMRIDTELVERYTSDENYWTGQNAERR